MDKPERSTRAFGDSLKGVSAPAPELEASNSELYRIDTHAAGPTGSLPFTPDQLRNAPSGDLFALSQNAGMGWKAIEVNRPNVMIISTMGGVRAPDGTPVALGLHTGHWELGLLVKAAAEKLGELGRIPFATYVSDPCDGRTQGTLGMMDSLPYRNDAAIVMRRLIRSLPTRKAVIGIATCDKGLPATMMALAGERDRPAVLIPGGVTLLPEEGEDAGKIQSIGARFAHDEISLEEAAELGCRTCATPGGGCQFLGTAATSQVVAEALGLAITHSALAPSGQGIWVDNATRSAVAAAYLTDQSITGEDVLSVNAFENAMTLHAACGGSTNLIIHIPAIAHAAGVRIPALEDWQRINAAVPRIVDVLPNGPVGYGTVQLYLAGGVPEVMLHLRDLGLLHLDCMTANGMRLGDALESWETSDRRRAVRERLREVDGVDPDDVIMPPTKARARGLTSTVTFPTGNIAPDGAVIKSTAIDPAVVGKDGVYRQTGPARVFVTERDAIAAVKSTGPDRINEGDVMVVLGRGPSGSGMEETYQITSALKYLPFGNKVALVTDARFSGVSTGACIGHVGPEALAGGPISRVRDGDLIEIVVDTINLLGSVNMVAEKDGKPLSRQDAEQVLNSREQHPDLRPDPRLPADTRLWAALQNASGGLWRGAIYDVERIVRALELGTRMLDDDASEG